MAALRGDPSGAFFDNVADPVQRLDILFERRAAEQANLGDVRRAMARQAALALDRFDHRGFFAADISAGAATQMDLGVLRKTRFLGLGDLINEKKYQLGIFIADIKVGVSGLDDPCRDQHALDKAVRIALKIITVLERT